jgi:hypothetical protein
VNVESVKYAVTRAVRRVGFSTARLRGEGLSAEDKATIRAVERYTMTTPERIIAVCDAVRYLCRSGIPGDLVECGVWRGGSMMAAALTLRSEGDTSRRLYLYDTYAGMAEPEDVDRDLRGRQAARGMSRHGRDGQGNSRWCFASLDEVRQNLESTGYPSEQVVLVEGKVEDTIPGTLPSSVGLLRLDTDWYASTAHELEHLFPLLVPGGVLILDDYGHWQGARQAVDEYLTTNGLDLLLNRIDYTGRIAVVPDRPGPPAGSRPSAPSDT